MNGFSKYSLALAFALIYTHSTSAQDYYPLEIDNEWFYRNIDLPPNDSTVSSSVKVVGDSLFSNGLRYFILNRGDIFGGSFVRKDSTYIYYMNPSTGQEHRVFMLNGTVGDTIHINLGPYSTVQLSAIDTVSVLGEQVRVRTYAMDGLVYKVLKFCEKFGPSTEWDYADPPAPWPIAGIELLGCRINGVNYGVTVNVTNEPVFALAFELTQNYPNPFNPETNISYSLHASGPVKLRVIDILGREVCTLVDELGHPGKKTVMWNGLNSEGKTVGSGVYFYELSTGAFRDIRRMILIR